MELEVEEEDGGRGQHDQGREGGAERHPQQEVVGGAAGGPEGLRAGAVFNSGLSAFMRDNCAV